MALRPWFILVLVCTVALRTQAQEVVDPIDRVTSFPVRFFDKINQKAAATEDQLARKTDNYLRWLQRQEQKLYKRLAKFDSTRAKQLLANSEKQYQQLTDQLNNTNTTGAAPLKGEYLPGMDSLKSSLTFLQQNNQLLGNNPELQQKVTASLGNVNALENKLQQTETVKAFIQERKQQLNNQLSHYTNLPGSITGCVTDFNKQAYYYNAQVKEYKELLNDPDKAVEKGLSVLSKLPAFQQFMQQHSELAALFGLPGNYAATESVAGLQTRTQVMQQIQTQLASNAGGGQQYLQQSLQSAQGQLNQLKDKLTGGCGDVTMPDFTPNQQKTKTFWKRLEYGVNLQTAKATYFFPTTTDIGLSIGYKLNDKSVIGMGASYKMGWGSAWNKITITHQGIGLRSFLDYTIKGTWFASGGFEYNYETAFEGLLPGSGTVWEKSGLLGISKIVSSTNKFFKKTKAQLLWDFLSYSQTPRTPEFKFRVGYSF